MDATSAGVSSPGGEKEMPGYVVPTYNTCSNNNTVAACIKLMWTPPPQASPLLGGEKEMPGHVVPTYNTCSNTNNRGFDRLRLRYVGASSSRVRAPRNARWPIATHHAVVPSVLSPSVDSDTDTGTDTTHTHTHTHPRAKYTTFTLFTHTHTLTKYYPPHHHTSPTPWIITGLTRRRRRRSARSRAFAPRVRAQNEAIYYIVFCFFSVCKYVHFTIYSGYRYREHTQHTPSEEGY